MIGRALDRLGPLGRLARGRRFQVWLALLALVALALCAVPLFGVIGFEAAFALALAVSLAGADLGAWVVRRARVADAPAGGPGRVVVVLTGRAIALALATLAAPLAILALDGLRVPACDVATGLVAMLALPATSAALLAATGVGLGLLAGPRRGWSNALPYLAILAILLLAGWRFYAEPPVFFYNALVGYFPGNLYDEDLVLGGTLLASRAHEIACVVAALALAAAALAPDGLRLRIARPPRDRRGPLALALVAAAIAGGLRLQAGALGFVVTGEHIAAELGGRHETEHFVIVYPAGGAIAERIELIGEDHEFRLAQLLAILELPPPTEKITSFYFGSAADKARFMGARNVYMAKPWRGEIYLHDAPFPHPTLRHEIAHAVAAAFGDPLFGVAARGPLGLPLRINVGLVEGLAVAADWPDHFDRALSPHESVRALQELGQEPPIERLLSTGFFAFSSAQSYTVAGSFLRWLYDARGGAAPLKALYRSGGDFEAAYGAPRAALIAGWRTMIEGLALPPRAAEVVRERFRRPSIFKRPCPHAVAAALREAKIAVGRGDLDGAIAAMRAACAMVPGEPSHELTLAKVLAEAERADEAAAILDRLAADAEVSSTLRAEAAIERAGVAARAGRLDDAAAVLDAAAALPLDDDLARNVWGRRQAIGHAGPAGDALRAYFFARHDGDDAARVARAAAAALAEPALGFAWYLLARAQLEHATDAEVARTMGRALDLGLAEPRLEREAAIVLAEAAYAAGDDDACLRAAAILAREGQPTVTRLYGEDWRARIAWRRGRPPRR